MAVGGSVERLAYVHTFDSSRRELVLFLRDEDGEKGVEGHGKVLLTLFPQEDWAPDGGSMHRRRNSREVFSMSGHW